MASRQVPCTTGARTRAGARCCWLLVPSASQLPNPGLPACLHACTLAGADAEWAAWDDVCRCGAARGGVGLSGLGPQSAGYQEVSSCRGRQAAEQARACVPWQAPGRSSAPGQAADLRRPRPSRLALLYAARPALQQPVQGQRAGRGWNHVHGRRQVCHARHAQLRGAAPPASQARCAASGVGCLWAPAACLPACRCCHWPLLHLAGATPATTLPPTVCVQARRRRKAARPPRALRRPGAALAPRRRRSAPSPRAARRARRTRSTRRQRSRRRRRPRPSRPLREWRAARLPQACRCAAPICDCKSLHGTRGVHV